MKLKADPIPQSLSFFFLPFTLVKNEKKIIFIRPIVIILLLLFTVSANYSLSKKSDIILLGTVLKLSPPPAGSNANAPSYSLVKYKVEEVYEGSCEEDEIVVDHLIQTGKELKGIKVGDEVELRLRTSKTIDSRINAEGIRSESEAVAVYYIAKEIRKLEKGSFPILTSKDNLEPKPTVNVEISDAARKDYADGSMKIFFDLKFDVKNESNEKFFFLKSEFGIDGIKVFKRDAGTNKLQSLYSAGGRPSNSGDLKWIRLGEDLANSKGNSFYLVPLEPQESFTFQDQYSVLFNNTKYTDLYGGISAEKVRREKELFFQFDIRTWNHNICTRTISRDDFTEFLSSVLKKEGTLWFENILSEPAALNVKSIGTVAKK